MAWKTTIDGAGRVVVPKAVRDRLGLKPGSTLLVDGDAGRVLLDARRPEVRLREEAGVLVAVLDGADVEALDHRRLREERLGRLGGR